MPVRRYALLSLCLLLGPAMVHADGPPAGARAAVAKQVPKVMGAAIDHYQWFHRHPELSGQEVNTAARMARALRAMGLDVHTGIGGHGLIAILRGKRDARGPVVLYRADMDALPVTEQTGLPYASQNQGVMHACGHDVHMATALGTLRVLAALADRWRGTVLFVGQPAEEIGAGARDMLADPKFRRILRRVGKPKVALALHDANLPAGSVSLVSGYANANVDSVDIIVHGKGGHGARPHQSSDPVVIGADIVMSLQTIVSRRVPPGEPAVITVGKFAAGTKHNIIPPQATLLLTVRSYSDTTRKLLLDEIRRVAERVAQAHNAPRKPTVTLRDEHIPAAYNDPTWTKRLASVFTAALGAKKVKQHAPSLGGEDFGSYARTLGIPGVMWRLGAVNPRLYRRTSDEQRPGLHSDRWAPDAEPTLKTGITTMSLAILTALETR